MKRTRFWIALGGVVVAGLGVYFGASHLVAQPPAPVAGAAPAPRSRIAIMNMAKVVKEFKHAATLDATLKAAAQVYATQLTGLRSQMTELQTSLAKEIDPKKKETLEKQIVELTRKSQDLQAEAQKEMNAKQGETWVQIYREIEATTKWVAEANDLDVIFSYPDAATKEEEANPLVAVGKLRSPAIMPIYYSPRLDITNVIIDTLNKTYPGVAAAPAPGAVPQK